MYFIFDNHAVDALCREYGGDPREMAPILNSAVSKELRDLAMAAIEYEAAHSEYTVVFEDIQTSAIEFTDAINRRDKSITNLTSAVMAYALKQKS
jgi:hypothetical protein